jgi:hypothetical protein
LDNYNTLKISFVKKNLILYSCVALLLGACKKNHDDRPNSPNTWTLYGNTYQATAVSYLSYGNLTASSSGTTSSILMFNFSTPPTSSGEMLISDSGPNTVAITVSVSTPLAGAFTTYNAGKTNVKANVVVNGKVSVSFPGKIWVHNWGNYSDSTQLSAGTITQQ